MRSLAIALLVACGGRPATSTVTSSTQPTSSASAAEAPSKAAEAPSPLDDKAACANRLDMFGPFQLTAAPSAARYGMSATTYTDAPTTKQKAIEVCGIAAATTWLRATRCAGQENGVQNGRHGSAGLGGRCDAMIDRYEVACPEATYQVFVDMYQCGPNEQFS